MRPETETKLQKIRNVSVIMRLICKGLLALVALAGLGSLLSLTFGVGGINYDNVLVQTTDLALGHRLALGAVIAATCGVLFKCVYHLHLLFGNYSRGEIFTRESVGQLRQFGIACLLVGVMNFVSILSLALSTHTTLAFKQADSLGIGAAIIVIAWFMDMAVDLREENELTI
jgi:DUF2975 family protein